MTLIVPESLDVQVEKGVDKQGTFVIKSEHNDIVELKVHASCGCTKIINTDVKIHPFSAEVVRFTVNTNKEETKEVHIYHMVDGIATPHSNVKLNFKF